VKDKVTIAQMEAICNMWNGTMFVDLDWPLNASSLLSASAELLVIVSYSSPCSQPPYVPRYTSISLQSNIFFAQSTSSFLQTCPYSRSLSLSSIPTSRSQGFFYRGEGNFDPEVRSTRLAGPRVGWFSWGRAAAKRFSRILSVQSGLFRQFSVAYCSLSLF